MGTGLFESPGECSGIFRPRSIIYLGFRVLNAAATGGSDGAGKTDGILDQASESGYEANRRGNRRSRIGLEWVGRSGAF